MAAKRATLNDALDNVPPAVAPAAVIAEQDTPKRAPIPSREGTALVGAHLPARYQKALKLLAAETEKSQRDLIAEALDMLFVAKAAKH
jgi:hypothetical protein